MKRDDEERPAGGDDAGAGDDPPCADCDAPLTIQPGEPQGPWHFREPDNAIFEYLCSRWYTIAREDRTWQVLIGYTRRRVYGAPRGHITVFKATGTPPQGNALPRLYPWVSFVETDAGDYCAIIPDPACPRFRLVDGARLTALASLAGQVVARADKLFTRMRNGPSLRLVVAAGNSRRMIEHAYWVACLRGRL